MRFIYFKELAHATVGDGNYEVLRASRQAGNPGFLRYNIEEEFLLSWKTTVFALKMFNPWDEAHLHYLGYLFYLKSTYYKG